jgi:hypothetical protein
MTNFVHSLQHIFYRSSLRPRIPAYECWNCNWVARPGLGISMDDPICGPFYCPECKEKLDDFDARDFEGYNGEENTMKPELITEFSCNDDGCHDKGKANGEQLFTLRSQDITCPKTICFWIMENIETCGEDKLRHALDDALRARKWPNRKRAD